MTGVHGAGHGRLARGWEGAAVGGVGFDAVAAVHKVVAKVLYLEEALGFLVVFGFSYFSVPKMPALTHLTVFHAALDRALFIPRQ